MPPVNKFDKIYVVQKVTSPGWPVVYVASTLKGAQDWIDGATRAARVIAPDMPLRYEIVELELDAKSL